MVLLLYYNLQIQYIQSATAWQENPLHPHGTKSCPFMVQ